jgi:benzodiazapine receptor
VRLNCLFWRDLIAATTTLFHAVVAIAPVAAAAVFGNLVTMPNIPTWYAKLAKPTFNPPNWVFAPAWTILYVLMAYSFFRLLDSASEWRSIAVLLFFIQIALNAAWSWIFFSRHSPRGGLVVIAGLWLAIAAMILAFWQVDHIASVLLLPYLAWVSFAAVLNWEIHRLNRLPKEI